MVNDKSIQHNGLVQVRHHHSLFDWHQIADSNGARSESFYPGSFAVRALEKQSRNELFAIFPELRKDTGTYGRSASAGLKPLEARLLDGGMGQT